MIQQMLEWLDNKSCLARGPIDVHHERHAVHVYFPAENEIKQFDKPAPIRRHKVETLESLYAAHEKFAAKEEGFSTVWVSGDKVVVVLDEFNEWSDRLDCVTMDVALSPIFDSDLLEETWEHTPKSLITLLTRHIGPNTPDGPEQFDEIVAQLNAIKFQDEDNVEQASTKGRDTMGRSIRAEAIGADNLADTLSFRFSGYPTLMPDDYCIVTISIAVDPVKKVIVTSPLMGSVDVAKRNALEDLHARISREMKDVDVFMGQP